MDVLGVAQQAAVRIQQGGQNFSLGIATLFADAMHAVPVGALDRANAGKVLPQALRVRYRRDKTSNSG
jgi:hypothetical protein